MERIVKEVRPKWEAMSPHEKQAVVNRVATAAGLFPEQALKRIEAPPCPRCGASNLEREDGFDVCNWCGTLSKEGKVLGA